MGLAYQKSVCALWGSQPLQAIIVDVTETGSSNVDDRYPSLQAMVPAAMKTVGHAEGNCRNGDLNARKKRLVIHHAVREQDFFPAQRAEMPR